MAAVDLAPLGRLLALAALLAALPLGWLLWRTRGGRPQARLAALTTLTLFLAFDLVVFGAFTRLSDSGLGCPDWPGCYGHASPVGAADHIAAAQQALPSGPVTWSKAWIEMIHRYLAMTVGALVLVLAVASVRARRSLPHGAGWALATLVWVLAQGLLGKYTVTLKLFPAVVTLHLLGGLGLLALLAWQQASWRLARPSAPPGLRALALAGFAVLMLQAALGGWVSSNYAVLACTGFPACNGEAWPAMDAGAGFGLWRELGRGSDGALLSFEALVAIHMAHRLFALVAVAVLAALAWRLWRAPGWRRFGAVLAALLLLQLASGLSNVVFGWPLAAALVHSAGAAALVVLLASVVALAAPAGSRRASVQPQPVAA
ncbi:COX15/CtaA family protein [Rubrivivax gelatinosus]|uniref:Cytochrome c oxidase assembly protein subunit 15 n=1 Tax=Rubrivivax gelatinosus TaxID=28068 RepID=A0A4R2MDC9_RUBGE|nr:COX15/CtaA family protein [Rubrivivax gelatinosus]MBK1689320.1 heme A synthase [Rubrivivax gelatinosus]TCP02474.1 cytochrome c oxidase assembly protein subunit 15 [Rubrivivax gelatinosus]